MAATLMPVPGTEQQLRHLRALGRDAPCPEPSCPEEVEQIVQVLEAGYRTCYRAENS